MVIRYCSIFHIFRICITKTKLCEMKNPKSQIFYVYYYHYYYYYYYYYYCFYFYNESGFLSHIQTKIKSHIYINISNKNVITKRRKHVKILTIFICIYLHLLALEKFSLGFRQFNFDFISETFFKHQPPIKLLLVIGIQLSSKSGQGWSLSNSSRRINVKASVEGQAQQAGVSKIVSGGLGCSR